MGISRALFATTAMAVTLPVCLAAPAFAQTAADSPAPQTVQTTPPVATSQDGIQDIIVTAQRRSENVQKASISISVVTPDMLAKNGVTQAQNLATTVAGLQIGQGGPATQIYIRGVGDFGSTAGTNPAVAFNVDGVYVPRPAGIEGNFYDLERVEVLKGPQGTLYGRNATGGAINVITAKPKLGVREMRGSIEVGNYNKLGADVAVNLPIGDTAAIRLAGQVIQRGPYVTYGFDDEVRQSVRGQLLWKPTEALSLRVSADYTHVGGGGAAFVVVPSAPGAAIQSPNVSPWTSGTDPVYANYVNALSVASNRCGPRGPGSPFNAFPFSGACPNIGPGGIISQAQLTFGSFGETGAQNNVFWNVSAQLDYDFGFATLTLLPAYRKASLDYTTYPGIDTRFDISAAGVPETSKATSFEARLAHDSSVLKWVLGGYYFKEDQFGYSNVRSGYLQNVIINQVIGTEAYAGFGQATYSVTNRFRLIAGGRYTSDHRTGSPQSVNLDPSLGFLAAVGASLGAGGPSCAGPVYPAALGNAFVGCPGPRLQGNKTFNKFNWKAGAEYDLTPRNMVYATASTGFKAGGIYAGQAADGSAASFGPENLTAFEVGSRNRFFDNTLQLNFEGFYYDYKDHQEPVIVLDASGTTVQAIQNAGSGRVFGGSVDMVFKPTRHDTLHFGVEYLDSKYTQFALSSPLIVGTPIFLPAGATGCPVINVFNAAGAGLTLPPVGVGVGTAGGAVLPGYTRGAVVGSQTQNCVGMPFTRSPKWSGVASYNHIFDLGGGADIEAEGNVQFQSSRYLATDYLPTSLAPAYATYNASLTYDAPGRNISVTAFIRNISNEAVYTATARSFSIVGLNSASIAPPRTYGARVNFKF